MQGCDDEGDNTAYCECTLNYLDVRYSKAEMESIYSEYERTGKYPPTLWDAVNACLDLYRE